MKLLVSVRDPHEALAAAAAGADFIDCKDPSAGALGALPTATVAAIVRLLACGFGGPTSATIGDVAADDEPAALLARVAAMAATGVCFVKVGIEPGPLAAARLVALALELRFRALMLDTADKNAGSLFDLVPPAALAAFIEAAHAAGVPVG
ncbi:(5-formylfuran-3-yl)methyl phosphate synthase, partial [Rubrivivax gelatinosus]|uniref:(5-formylfuran-3-yl)methyl phosphate synthase n=1 Tax=Rubrivivax gelatinosus TaxID=28068 RepID=UPI0005C13B4D